jgi:hypothetical protein
MRVRTYARKNLNNALGILIDHQNLNYSFMVTVERSVLRSSARLARVKRSVKYNERLMGTKMHEKLKTPTQITFKVNQSL